MREIGERGSEKGMKADEKTAGEVVEAMTSLLGAYEAHNLEQVMDLYAPDPDATALGTNLDQFLTGSEAIRQAYGENFDAFGRIGLKMMEHQVSAEGGVAWLSAKCLASFEIDGDEISTRSRLTAVLVRRTGQWKVIQFHLTFPSDESGIEIPVSRL